MIALDLLKLYPKRSSFFVGSLIGLSTWAISREMYSLFVRNGANPFYELALLLGSVAVGGYCCTLAKDISGKIWKITICLGASAATFLAMKNGIRNIFGISEIQDIGECLSYIVSFGIICLLLFTGIDILTRGELRD
jgi:hypothetical protein